MRGQVIVDAGISRIRQETYDVTYASRVVSKAPERRTRFRFPELDKLTITVHEHSRSFWKFLSDSSSRSASQLFKGFARWRFAHTCDISRYTRAHARLTTQGWRESLRDPDSRRCSNRSDLAVCLFFLFFTGRKHSISTIRTKRVTKVLVSDSR